MARSDIYTGSITWASGEQAQDRWVYCTAAGQKSKTLTVASSGPSYPTRDNMIISDQSTFDFIAVQFRTVKTVQGAADTIAWTGTGGIKRVYAWGGPDFWAMGPLRYNGDGNGPAFLHCGQSTTPAANSMWNANVGHFMQNGEGVNAENISAVPLSPNPYTLLAGPFKVWGVHLHFHMDNTSTLSATHTWTIEVAFHYW